MPLESLNRIILDPAYADYLAILKGARNGLVYGAKVRFPHALVMAVLFGRGSWTNRIKNILRATKTHALNLAKFVTIYKTLLLVQRKASRGKTRKADTFIAGLIGGYIVFGERNAINEQIVLYIISRVVASFIPRDVPPSAHPYPERDAVKPLPPNARIFSFFAAVSWGAVMYLFKERGETIQPGLFNSMTYIYNDSNYWEDLRTLIWHNK
ncbi:hypothetical protein FRC04_007836 [Tulasnella sp. 424]|nr:hypothetical protein FRC04_007836 [Tulasnella sp. 424]KAG8975021.1 hypothetical protein FRC05_006444 [Tulasnella sp. 425]